MSFFEFPHTRTYDNDLGWVIKTVNHLEEVVETFVNNNVIRFADPIQWSITSQYEKSVVVLDSSGNAFISKQPVPSGIQLNNDDYWLEIFNFIDYVKSFNSNLTMNIETDVTQASTAYNIDDWLLWDDILYKVTANIAINDDFIIGTNIERFTVEDFCRAWQTYMVNTIQQYKNDIDASELQYKNDIDASELAYKNQLDSSVAATTASLQAQLDAAIAGVTVDSEVINARIGEDGITYTTLGDAIRGQLSKLYAINTGFLDMFYNNGKTTGNILSLYTKRMPGYRVSIDADGVLNPTPMADNVLYIIPVEPNSGYFFTFARYMVLLKKDMATSANNYLYEEVYGTNTTANTYYMAISFNTNDYPESTYLFYDQYSIRGEEGAVYFDPLRLTAIQKKYLTTNIYQDDWELGDVDTSTGIPVPGSSTLRSAIYCPVKSDKEFMMEVDSMARGAIVGYIYQYAHDKDYYGSGNIITVRNNTVFTLQPRTEFILIVLAAAYGTTYNNDVRLYQEGGLVKNIQDLLGDLYYENSHIIIVDKNGGGDFISLRQAVAHSVNGDVIFVRRGVYDNQEVEAWNKNVTIVGESPYNTIISNYTDDYNTPPLEMSCGAVYNIQFHAHYDPDPALKAYALHIDNNNQANNTFYAENCIFITDDGPAAVGAGSRINSTQVYKNCIFENMGNREAFFGNESTNAQAGGVTNNQYFKFYNCQFRNHGTWPVVIMRGMKSNGTTVYCTFVDCSFMDSGTNPHPIFRMDYSSPGNCGTSTNMGDMGLINWNLDPISSGNTIPDLNKANEGIINVVP